MHFEVGTISGPSAIFMNSYIDDGRHLLGSIVGRIHRRDTQDHAVLDRLNRASSIPRIRHAIRGVRAFFPKLENLKTSRHTTPMRCTPTRYTPIRYTPSEMHAHMPSEVHAHEIHTHEVHTQEVRYKVYA
jgi:hypothetical protein